MLLMFDNNYELSPFMSDLWDHVLCSETSDLNLFQISRSKLFILLDFLHKFSVGDLVHSYLIDFFLLCNRKC